MAYKKFLFFGAFALGILLTGARVKATSDVPAPEIYSPSSREVISYTSGEKLEWEALDGAVSYEVQLRCNGCDYNVFAPGISKTKISSGWRFILKTNSLDLPQGLEDSLYRFRVRAKLSDGERTPFSAHRYFSLQESETSNDTHGGSLAPHIVKPAQNAILTNFPRTATLSWSRVANAKSYEIELACDVCASVQTKWLRPATYSSTKTLYTTNPLAGDNEFRFRVRAIFAGGTLGKWSPYQYFRYNTASFVDENKMGIVISPELSNSPAFPQEKITFSAEIPLTEKNQTLKIFLDNRLVQTCVNANSCSYTKTVTRAVKYQFKSYNANGSESGTTELETLRVVEHSGTDIPTLSIKSSSNYLGRGSTEMVTITARSDNGTRLDKIEIYAGGIVQMVCLDVVVCSDRVNVLAFATKDVEYYAIGYFNGMERRIHSQNKFVTVEINLPTLSFTANKTSLLSGEEIAFTANASSPVDKIEFYVNGRKVTSCDVISMIGCTRFYTPSNGMTSLTVYAKATINRSGEMVYSPTQVIPVSASTLEKPVIINPKNNDSYSGYPTNILLSWSNVSNVSHYKVVIDCAGCDASDNEWRVKSTSFPVSNSTLFVPQRGAAEYRFRVLPVYSTGGGVWSDYQYFHYTY